MIDLHCHSTYSDGALTPLALIEKAKANQVRCLSLTDHDSVAGYPELLEAAQTYSIAIIPGIEFSTRWKKYEIHILGYQMQFTSSFNALIGRQIDNRIERAQRIAQALEQIGVNNAYAKACELAGHERAARPHFAKILVIEGKARDLQAAFRQYLVRGRCAYIETAWLSVAEAVAGIQAAGGKAVIAHPLKYGLTRSKLHELINEFKEAGGVGLEVVSGAMNVSEINEIASLCHKMGLLASSGSDFHSELFSSVSLGKQKKLPESCRPIWSEWTI